MADGVSKGVYPRFLGSQLSLNKFFDPSTPSMRKANSGGNKQEKNGEKTVGNSGHYVIASSLSLERRLLERRLLER